MLRKDRNLVLLATGLALGIALWRLGADSLWQDEFHMWQLAHYPLERLRQAASWQWQPPLYYFFMHFWVQLGASEFWLRLPSALFFAATVPVAAAIARTLAGEARAGVYAAFLIATTPYMVHYAQATRGYTAITLACAFALLATARLLTSCRAMEETTARPAWLGAGLLEAGRAIGRGEWRRARRALGDDGAWFMYIVSLLAAMGMHNTLVLLPFVTGLIVLLGTWRTPSRIRWPALANLALATGVIAIAYLPQARFFLHTARLVQERFWWDFPSLETILVTLVRVYGQEHFFGAIVFAMVLCLAAVAFASWFRNRKWHWLAFAVVGWLGWPVLILLASWLYKPVFINRLLYWSVLPSRVVAGIGLHLLPLPRLRPVILVAVMALNLHAIHGTWYSPPYQPWNRLVEIIAEDARPVEESAVVLCGNFVHGFNFYWRGREDIAMWRVLSGQEEGRINRLPPPSSHPTGWWKRIPDHEDASGLFPRYRRVYFFDFVKGKEGSDCEMDLYREIFSRGGRLVREEELSPRMSLFIYERK